MLNPVDFVSFGDSSCKRARKRLAKQARRTQFFRNVKVLSEKDLDADFVDLVKNRMVPGSRGFGYWVWKPQVILQELAGMCEGEILFYADVGCHLTDNAREGLVRYARSASLSESGVLCSVTEHPEYQWTKGDILNYFNVRADESITHSNQRQATFLVLRKCQPSVQLVREWLKVCVEFETLIDDSPSSSPNLEGFVENRHDQSIFSILSKLSGSATFDSEELMNWARDRADRIPGSFPVEARRDRYSLLGRSRFFVGRFLRKLGPWPCFDISSRV